ncbi:PD-(D/E)XK nuclease family protein, partial [Allosphingosinicella sp.]|uniref:PD-(D/E)XK nuclease family protein n=1 Tax=Allosphingosinicella sp. TaxID=2823234 RepID=UPI002FC1C92E
FDSTAVTEYKSSLPDPVRADAASIVDGYWRQLRLYSVLIGELGSWPATARIVAASGQVLEEPVHRPACEAEADAAISGLDAMNHALSTGCDSAALASPGQVACGQCPYMAICPAFWSWSEANPWPELLEPAARGTLLSVDPGMDGDLYAVNVRLTGRYGAGGDQSLALRKSVHGDLTGFPSGSALRIVYANLRPDGRLRADVSTCVFGEAEIPELRCGSG